MLYIFGIVTEYSLPSYASLYVPNILSIVDKSSSIDNVYVVPETFTSIILIFEPSSFFITNEVFGLAIAPDATTIILFVPRL